MKKDIILAGVGGQGLLSIAAVIGEAALKSGLFIKQAEVHGMAQRGGVVQSHVRLSDKPIYSDLIKVGSADLILATEPLEALRYLAFLKERGMLVTNAVPFKNVNPYPQEKEIDERIEALPHHLLVDAMAIAKEAGSIRCANMVVLGAGSPFIALTEEALRTAIEQVFSGKDKKIIETNLKGFDLGREASLEE
ncbi:MAG: indolepyruvate oxidoreductase subunit beta [Candidatus Bipolaricaulota bacterium]|nr:indolepyruvate oxidoreductase subunit beta [Candidatus Bipolaricaulota bacterium]